MVLMILKTTVHLTLKRSAGIGVRVFMPAFGLLGIDFGYGFDSFKYLKYRSKIWMANSLCNRSAILVNI